MGNGAEDFRGMCLGSAHTLECASYPRPLLHSFWGHPTRVATGLGICHTIELEQGIKAIITTPYRHPKAYKDEIERAIHELLALGHIRPSTSPFASSVVLVKKRDNTLRMCIDYRALNKKTMKNCYPIPRIDELMDELRGAKFFSKINLRSGYHQIKVSYQDVPKAAFRCHYC